MRANPGGEIAPEEVIGRDRFIVRIWDTLRDQSVLMVAERRIGKTTVVKKMLSAVPDGVHLVYRDVEGVRTPLEFAEAVAKDVEGCGALGRATKLRGLLKHLAGVEIAGVLKFPPQLGPHWKALLESAIEDLLEHDPETTYVFVWDELPLMLEKIRQESGEQTAMDVLDTLRGLRQGHSSLRMIYTGSIGLHHVLSGLRDAGHANAPTNDMRTMEVGELRPEDGRALARELIAGEGLRCADLEGTAAAIASAVDHVPFYIHLVVAGMRDLGNRADEEVARSLVQDALVDAQDAWHLKHYRDRLEGRYGHERLPIVLTLLDELAASTEPLSFAHLASRVRSTIPREKAASRFVTAVLDGDDERIRELLDLLQRDHYLKRDRETGYYCFRFSLIRRWWHLQRSRT